MAKRAISGSIELHNDRIYVSCTIDVNSVNFRFVSPPEIFNGDYKGITFRYFNFDENHYDDYDGGDERLTIVFDFDNKYNWNHDDLVRIMPVNEYIHTDFRDLVDAGYFERRMEHFQHRDDIEDYQLFDFNTTWNDNNHGRQVEPRNHKEEKTFSPRLTKKDILLSVTRR